MKILSMATLREWVSDAPEGVIQAMEEPLPAAAYLGRDEATRLRTQGAIIGALRMLGIVRSQRDVSFAEVQIYLGNVFMDELE